MIQLHIDDKLIADLETELLLDDIEMMDAANADFWVEIDELENQVDEFQLQQDFERLVSGDLLQSVYEIVC